MPSPLPDPGPLWRFAGVVDTPDRFEVMIGELDRPGRIGRTLLRRSEVHESFRIWLDVEGLHVHSERRGATETEHVPAAEVVALHRSWKAPAKATAITTAGLVPLPGAGHIDAPGAEKMLTWTWARINQRLGV